MLDPLLRAGTLGGELCRRASSCGVSLIWRAQVRDVRSVMVRDGKVEETRSTSSAGQGLQVISDEGYSALGSRDEFEEGPSLSLLDRTVAAAARGAELGLARQSPATFAPAKEEQVPDSCERYGEVDLEERGRRLVELERDLAGRHPGLRFAARMSSDLDGWRIRRHDGTDVTFAMPRSVLHLSATSRAGSTPHSVGAAVSSPDPSALWNGATFEMFLKRADQAAELASRLGDAPHLPAGSYPLVIDYALAKGLAHEAFGHASEADQFGSSVLAEGGRFKVGEHVGAEHVSIIDEPVAGDHAWQPISANGEPRRRAVIVDHGRLRDGLADLWSAGPGGIAPTGAARAQSYRHAPLPRMSNIRLEVDEPLPAPGAFEDYGPEEVRALLSGAGVLKRHRKIVFLSGYSGGQVNTATGDFVFHCKAIYTLSAHGVELHKPAIFTGSMFGALQSVREAFGPLRLDALGTCGKWGQRVPSSGGSHYFVFLEPHPSVRLGGR